MRYIILLHRYGYTLYRIHTRIYIYIFIGTLTSTRYAYNVCTILYMYTFGVSNPHITKWLHQNRIRRQRFLIFGVDYFILQPLVTKYNTLYACLCTYTRVRIYICITCIVLTYIMYMYVQCLRVTHNAASRSNHRGGDIRNYPFKMAPSTEQYSSS